MNRPTHPGVSVFEPHAAVHVRYPSIDLTRSYDEELALAPIAHSELRYEPRPLINDAAVKIHAGRNTYNESKFVSLTAALFGKVKDWGHSSMDPDARLLYDMRAILRCNSSTTLKVVTYQLLTGAPGNFGEDGKTDDEIGMIRISRFTTIRGETVGDVEHSHSEYEMTTDLFDALDCREQWLTDMRNMVQGRSDRAVRHVALILEGEGADNPPVVWKRARSIEFSKVLEEVTQVVDVPTLDAGHRQCFSCTSDFDKSDHRPLTLLCSTQPPHVMCQRCLQLWCEAQGPSNAACPHCRNKIFVDETMVERLTFGTVGKAYMNDDRFDDWENFTRSVADLDKYLADDRVDELTVRSQQLVEIWVSLIDGELLEGPQSTPYHLQPARAPEYAMLFKAVTDSLAELDGAKLSIGQLYEQIIDDIYRAYKRALLRSPLALSMDAEEKEEVLHGVFGSKLLLRPGFVAFFERTISRMLMFGILRQCDCDLALPGQRFHNHGMRRYYSGDAIGAGADAAL